MANISDLSGDEREQRIAELKQKMQDAARKKQEAQAAGPAEAESAADSGSESDSRCPAGKMLLRRLPSPWLGPTMLRLSAATCCVSRRCGIAG